MSAKLGNGTVTFGDGSSMSSATLPYSSISGTPTNLNQFTNGPGYITSYPTNLSSYTNGPGYITTSRTLFGSFSVSVPNYGGQVFSGYTGIGISSGWPYSGISSAPSVEWTHTGGGINFYGGADVGGIYWGPVMCGSGISLSYVVGYTGSQEIYADTINYDIQANGDANVSGLTYTVYVYGFL